MTQDLTYLTFAPFENLSIKLKEPLNKKTKNYDISTFCKYLIDYQQLRESNSAVPDTCSKIQHWWNRKWEVSLDYYLSSPSERMKKTQPDEPFQSDKSMDIAFYEKIENSSISSIKALLHRKTYRKFQERPITSFLLSTLLGELKEEIFKNIWKYYLVVFDVEGIQPGIYLYCSYKHGLSLVKEGLFREELVQILCGMAASYTASFLVIFVIDLEIAMHKFPYNRALREIYVDSGRLAQKILLKGMQHSVGGLPSPAMKDSNMCSFLQIDPSKYTPVYSVSMGIISDISTI